MSLFTIRPRLSVSAHFHHLRFPLISIAITILGRRVRSQKDWTPHVYLCIYFLIIFIDPAPIVILPLPPPGEVVYILFTFLLSRLPYSFNF